MPELYRLEGRTQRGKATLVLTESHILLEPDQDFRFEVEEALAKGKESADKAPGVIGWVVGKALNFAGRAVERAFQPHSLKEVELKVKHDRVALQLGMLNIGSDLEVDPVEAYIFEAKFHDAKQALERR